MKKIDHHLVMHLAEEKGFADSARASLVVAHAQNLLIKNFPDTPVAVQTWKQRIVWINVPNAAWAQKIFYFSETILTELRKEFPEYSFESVRTRVSG